MFELKHQPTKQPRQYPNSQSGLLSWEEALDYIYEYQHALEAIICHSAYDLKRGTGKSVSLDLSSNWDISTHRPKAKDFIINMLGLADYFEIIH